MPDAVGDRTAEPTVEERLSSAVRQASGGSSRLVVLVGEPRRALFLARRVLAAGPPWRLAWTPTGPRNLGAGLRLAAELATAGALDGAEPAGGTLVRLTVPALVLVGTADRLTPPWHAHRLAEALPLGLGVVEVPDAGHMTPVQAPEAITAAVHRLADDYLHAPRRAVG